MPAYEPEECDLLLYAAVEAGDLDAALDLYEPEAVFVVPPGMTVTGRAAIRKVLLGMVETKAKGKLEAVTSAQNSDGSVAFTRAKGNSTSVGPDGTLITTQFHSVEVVRKQFDGTWRIAIDDPSGTGFD